MGRLTKGSKRTRIQDYMKKMRDTFRAARAHLKVGSDGKSYVKFHTETMWGSMPEAMVCSICGAETPIRHGVDLRQDIWCCPRCFRIYQSLKEFYSKKGYDKERCLIILRQVVEKQKRQDIWPGEVGLMFWGCSRVGG